MTVHSTVNLTEDANYEAEMALRYFTAAVAAVDAFNDPGNRLHDIAAVMEEVAKENLGADGSAHTALCSDNGALYYAITLRIKGGTSVVEVALHIYDPASRRENTINIRVVDNNG